jgi:hypothetical protein
LNIFVTSPWPAESAIVLPDRHVTKMALEACQMLSIVASEKWGHGYGTLPKTDGTPYKTEKGAFRNHPCTQWASKTIDNAYWLIKWGMNLCDEYTLYGMVRFIRAIILLWMLTTLFPKGKLTNVTPFVRAMPEEWKHDDTIDTFTAYKRYIASKPWVKDNYLRMPQRKPDWI